MAQPVNILFFIDHRVREMDCLTAVARLLNQKGLTTAFVPLRGETYHSLTSYTPDLACFTWFYFHENSGFNRIRRYWPNARYVNLAFEQSVNEINKNLKAPKHPYVVNEVWQSSWTYAWDEELGRRGVPANRREVNGHPVMALYQEPYSTLYPTKEVLAKQFKLDLTKRWILIPENFNPAFHGPEKVDEYVAAGENRAEIEAYFQWARDSLDALVDWLMATPDDVELIFRPRPGIGMKAYQERFGERLKQFPKSVKMLDDLTVREWILASDVVASNLSTSLMESALACKDTFVIAPLPFPDRVMIDWQSKVTQIQTKDQYLGALDGSFKGDPTELADWVKSTMMPVGDPIAKLADWLAEVHKEANALPKPLGPLGTKIRSKELEFKSWKRKTKLKLKGGYQLPPVDVFSDEDIATRGRDWQRILG